MIATLAAGEALVLRTDQQIRLSVITDDAATATVSRVDQPDAAAHTTGSENAQTVEPSTLLTVDVDWAFYRVSSAGGVTRVAFI